MQSEQELRKCFDPHHLDVALRMCGISADKRSVYALSLVTNLILDKGGSFDIRDGVDVQSKVDKQFLIEENPDEVLPES